MNSVYCPYAISVYLPRDGSQGTQIYPSIQPAVIYIDRNPDEFYPEGDDLPVGNPDELHPADGDFTAQSPDEHKHGQP